MSTGVSAAGQDRAGFSKNSDIQMKDYSISIPDYFESDIYNSEEYRAYCKDDTFTMLIIDVFGGAGSFSFKDNDQRELFIQSMLAAMGDDGKLAESSYKTFGSVEGAYAVFDITIEGQPFKGTMFATIDGDTCYCFMLAESPDNKYDYQPDFFKILSSAQKAEAAADDKDDADTSDTDETDAFDADTKEAIEDAKKYLALYGFSKQGLIVQLSSEFGSGHSVENSTKAVEYLEETMPIDWNEQAVKSAETYQSVMDFSRDSMIEMLTSEYGGQYTKEQAEYAVDKLGLK
jgi:hypothetical protein